MPPRPPRRLSTGVRLIENAISPGGDPVIGLYLFMVYARLVRSLARGTPFAAINPAAIGVPAVLQAHPGLSQTELAELLGVERATAGEQVAQCLRDGLVTRKRSSEDRRKYALYISAKGRANLKRIAGLIPLHEQFLFGRLTSRERAGLYHTLGKLIDDAETAAL